MWPVYFLGLIFASMSPITQPPTTLKFFYFLKDALSQLQILSLPGTSSLVQNARLLSCLAPTYFSVPYLDIFLLQRKS